KQRYKKLRCLMEFCPPTARWLRVEIIGISARPDGSSATRLPQLARSNERHKGLNLAHRTCSATSAFPSILGDQRRCAGDCQSDPNDPLPTYPAAGGG